MTPLRIPPSTREQARQALLLLGVPAPARIVVAVHRALFDGDLDVPALAALLRAERRSAEPVVCCGLTPELAGRYVALAEWPVQQRIVLPDGLSTALRRVGEFVAAQPGASRAAARLLAELAEAALADSGGREAALADSGGGEAALAESGGRDPALLGASVADPVADRAALLEPIEQLFGRASVPHQRDGR